MKLSELQETLHAADPAAVLVSPRVLSRVIHEVCHIRGLQWSTPHSRSYVVDRQVLFRHVEQEELELESNHILPETVILLARPGDDDTSHRAVQGLLLRFWRHLFHAKVHLTLQQRHAEGQLSQGQLRNRLELLGTAEVQEIRTVLLQENLILPEADDRVVYEEFAAVFLELCYFAPRLLPGYFPGLHDPEKTKKLLAQDVDADALFQQTRLKGAPDPRTFRSAASDEAYEFYQKLVHWSEKAAREGNLVRAATLRRRAARVAPTPLASSARAEAVRYLEELLKRLQVALQLTDDEAGEWLKDLPTLLDRADQGRTPVEATLLYDLQKTCLEYERDLYALDIIEWALSGGRRPIKRPLPSQRLVRVLKQLRGAAERLTAARLAEEDRQHFGNLLQAAMHKCEERLRASFRPVLSTALQDVGLRPRNPLERTAFHKVIEEILDRIIAHGFLTFGDLRDTVSRNQLKLPDVATPQEYIRGDPLLRLDRRLATLLDGVYRPSELYLRLLERVTALAFGTGTGRFLTQYVLVPLGGAFGLIEVVNILGHYLRLPQLSPWLYYLVQPGSESARELGPMPQLLPWFYFPTLAVLTLFIFGLWHRPAFRRHVARVGWDALVALRRLLIDVPVSLVRVPALRWFVSSWAFQLCYWFLFKPLAVVVLIWLVLPDDLTNTFTLGGLFVAVLLLINSRIGRATSEGIFQGMLRLFQLIRDGLLQGLVQFVLWVFKTAVEAVEYVLFTVDEWLRFRSGDTRTSMVVRAVLGVVWFPISYAARFYMLVLVEPGFNPIKMPISVVAAKLMVPLLLVIYPPFYEFLRPVLGDMLAGAFAGVTVSLLPDAVGFIVWETKENWSLYRATRPRVMPAVAVGSHGETIRALLHPGFHSGTVPKYFGKLRVAERRAIKSGNWSTARYWRHHLEDVEEAVRRFVTRELAYLVNQSVGWQGRELKVGRVRLACNRIMVELDCEGLPGPPCLVQFEDAHGWLVANIVAVGWLDRLSGAQARAFNTGLASLYKLAGVELVREQLAANLPQSVSAYDIHPEGLVLWMDPRHGQALLCDLRRHRGLLRPVGAPELEPGQEATYLDVRGLLYAEVPLSWQQCLEIWNRDQEGLGQPPLMCGGEEILLLGSATPPDVAQTVVLDQPSVSGFPEPHPTGNGESSPRPDGPPASRASGERQPPEDFPTGADTPTRP